MRTVNDTATMLVNLLLKHDDDLEVLQRKLEGALLDFRALALRSDAEARLATRLLEITNRGKQEKVLVNQQHLADDIGASRSYVSTLLNIWKGEGIIRSAGRTLTVESPAALIKKAQK